MNPILGSLLIIVQLHTMQDLSLQRTHGSRNTGGSNKYLRRMCFMGVVLSGIIQKLNVLFYWSLGLDLVTVLVMH